MTISSDGDAIRVLHVMPFTGMGGGAPRAALTLIQELQGRRPQWVFALLDDEFSQEARSTGATVICGFPDTWPNSRLKRWAGTIRALHRAVREHRIDLIHCHSAPGNRYCYPASRLTGVPLVSHQRDTYKPNHFHAWVHRTDHIIATSDWVRRSLPEKLHGKITVIHDAVQIPAAADIVWPRESGPMLIGMAGRTDPLKGLDLLVDAASLLLRRFEFRIEVWGYCDAPPYQQFAYEMRRKIAEAGMNERLALEGYRLDMPSLYRRVDIMVVPSRVAEGFGLTAAEAQAWGKTVIVAGHGGLAEIVLHEKNGLHFIPDDAASLAEQLARVLSDPALRRTLTRAARASAAERFSPKVHADRTEAVYRAVLNE